MKPHHYFFIISTMLLLFLGTTDVFAMARPRLVVSGFGVSDGLAVVGGSFNLLVNVTNIDSVCARTATVAITASAPFILQSASSALPVDICGGETKTVKIPLRVDTTAVGGSYLVPITLGYEDTLNTPYSSSDSITLFVSGTPNILAHVSSSSPIDVYPGDTATISVVIENAGTFDAQMLSATLSAAQDSDLEVKWANSVATVGSLSPKKSFVANYAVEVPKNSASFEFPMDLTVQYLNEKRELQSKVISLTFNAHKKALFSLTDGRGVALYPNDDLKSVSVMLKNTGTDTAYKVKAKAAPQYPFTADGSVRYVESLAPGQSAPVNFVFDIDKSATVGDYGLDVIIDFEDSQGKLLHDTSKMAVSVSSKNVWRAVFADYWFLWLVAIVVVVVVFRKRSAKHAAKK